MNFVIGKYYRDTFGRKLQYIGINKNLHEFVLNNPNGSKIHIRFDSTTDPMINQFVLIDDEDNIQSDNEYPDDFNGGKVRRRKSRRRKSRRRKSRRKKSRRRS